MAKIKLQGVQDLRQVATRVHGVGIADAEVWKMLAESRNVTVNVDLFREGHVLRGLSDFSLNHPATADELIRHVVDTVLSPEWAPERRIAQEEGADELRWWFWLKDKGKRVGCIIFTPLFW